jgi:fermentation-respiration switch protein FrsA (DUF1100 family)
MPFDAVPSNPTILHITLLLVGLAVILWLAAASTVWARQERLIFRPDERRLGEPPVDLAATARFQAAQLTTRDGLDLAFWAAAPLSGMPTLVLFHGRAGNAADRAAALAPFASVGYGVVLAEYRGYGGNPGRPSEAGFLIDARAHLDWVKTTWGDAAPVVCGESLGSGVAIAVASERAVSAVVLDAPYTSLADLAASSYRWLPARALLRHRFDNISRLPAVRAPLLVVHGAADAMIPAGHGCQVAAAAGGPVEFVLVTGVGHPVLGSDPTGRGAEAVQRFLARLSAPLGNAAVQR